MLTKFRLFRLFGVVNESIYEIDTIENWDKNVMKAETPVLLQCYAEWCDRSRQISLMLSNYFNLDKGKWGYAKLNVESLPLLAQSVQIKKIPALFILNQGALIERVEGNLDEKSMEDFVNVLRLMSGICTKEDIIIAKINKAADFLHQNKILESIDAYKDVISSEFFLEKYELTCWVALARGYLDIGDLPNAEIFAKRISSKYGIDASRNIEVSKLVNTINHAVEKSLYKVNMKEYRAVITGLQEDILFDYDNTEKHCKLAAAHFEFGFHEEAIKKAFEVIEMEQSLTGDGYELLLEILTELGSENSLVKEANKKLHMIHTNLRNN
ncbi:unnamed protein product [Blepharisma stoltei]|uniref:Thioredoxin domain-containing protein n=1 Tax=Blepharisma stoltei TaxID=1481888 RepID=A0AAU9ICB7_9CILI|nr:unnamed protein product [Blepharisma stoltei]